MEFSFEVRAWGHETPKASRKVPLADGADPSTTLSASTTTTSSGGGSGSGGASSGMRNSSSLGSLSAYGGAANGADAAQGSGEVVAVVTRGPGACRDLLRLLLSGAAERPRCPLPAAERAACARLLEGRPLEGTLATSASGERLDHSQANGAHAAPGAASPEQLSAAVTTSPPLKASALYGDNLSPDAKTPQASASSSSSSSHSSVGRRSYFKAKSPAAEDKGACDLTAETAFSEGLVCVVNQTLDRLASLRLHPPRPLAAFLGLPELPVPHTASYVSGSALGSVSALGAAAGSGGSHGGAGRAAAAALAARASGGAGNLSESDEGGTSDESDEFEEPPLPPPAAAAAPAPAPAAAAAAGSSSDAGGVRPPPRAGVTHPLPPKSTWPDYPILVRRTPGAAALCSSVPALCSSVQLCAAL